ncbi:ribonuclease H-like domain-containing protein [Tanacetum coccineum]
MSVHNSEHNSPINSDQDDDVHDLVTRISKLDISDPLHLHPNDTTALTVVSIKLKGTENYQVWSCAMLLALEGKNKIGFIDGSCKRSNTDEVLGKQWDRVNAIVLGWILNSISEELFLGQIFSKRAKHVWEELKETYDKVDGSIMFGLHNQINTLKQNGSSIADYYHKLNALWKQYDAMIELPKCVCNASEGFKKHNQLLKLMQFLMGLDDSYMQIRSSILSRETLPDVRSAYATISSEESNRVVVGSIVGATQHLTYTDKELDNVLDIFHLKIKVGRPNGTEAYISKIGNLKLSNGLTLYDVMVLPEYCVTLISVHKLIKENKHDWHYRLGHPADPVLNVLKDSLNIDKKDNIRVANDLNKDKSDSSSSSVSGSNINTVDFPVDSRNDADSSDDIVATQNEEVATLEENVFSDFKYELEKYVGYSKLNSENFCFVSQLNKTREPKTYFEASKYSHWTNAMNQEMDALLRDGTWELVDLPEGRKAIGSKWIYKIKFRSNGEIDRYKARLLDVNNAFLYGDLEEVVFMKQPEGYFPSNNKVCRLKKSLYGLKQAPRQWNAKLTSTLIENGFSQSKYDYSLYTKSDKGVFLALLVYVDDIIITSNSVSEIEEFKVFLKSKFMIKDLGKLKYFLRIEVVDTDKGICLNQRKYVLDLLSEYGMLACKPAKTPLMSKLVFSNEAYENDPLLENITDYQKLIGKMIYLTNTRPDISYVVYCLSQFMHSHLSSHLTTAFKILRYLKGCPGLGIHIARTSAECRALASVTSEVIWILKILKDLQVEKLLPVSLHCDSNSAIKIAVNPVFHERTKHLEIDLHFVREKILKGVVKTVKVDSANQIAYILTKGLDIVQHFELVKRLDMDVPDVMEEILIRSAVQDLVSWKKDLYDNRKWKVVGSSNVLVCLAPLPDDVLVLVNNPLTEETRKLPLPYLVYKKNTSVWDVCLSFGYDSITYDYKVVLGIWKGNTNETLILVMRNYNVEQSWERLPNDYEMKYEVVHLMKLLKCTSTEKNVMRFL